MNSTDIKTNLKPLRSIIVTPKTRKREPTLKHSIFLKSESLLPNKSTAINWNLNGSKELKLKARLNFLTQPDQIKFDDKNQAWLKEIQHLYQALQNELTKNTTPATVGEYYQQILEK